ncbi:peptidoglycan-binding protein [Actinomyces culturomici]|uniref:peptidoglycan-binding protein n=1 Tax=Actinomyces culturomici TaxID=1926276 RepID=UPI000E1FC02D|nr:peptidoglycan-binding protein [Actinomyces culturomici]
MTAEKTTTAMGADSADTASFEAEPHHSPNRRKRGWIFAAGAAGLLAVAGAIGVGAGLVPSAHAEEPKSYTGATDVVSKGELSGETSFTATLKYADPHPIASGFEGVATALPKPGETIGLGGHLNTVGDEPSYLMRGSVPAWRELSLESTDGEDVRQLEQSLKELGFFNAEPDAHFNWTTHWAVVNWQKSVGLVRNGVLPLGRLVFENGDLRVGSSSARVGNRVSTGQALYTATSTSQVVDAQVGLSDQGLAAVGGKATLHLPDGTTTTGTIASVGAPVDKTSQGSGDQGSTTRVIPIQVTPDDANAVAKWQEAQITLGLASEKKEDVLSVPVGALLALDPKTFGVEIVKKDGTTQRVPVTPGLFAAGRVEVSGDGVHEGDRVAVPEQ